ncbi:MAG: prepilin-type N-terminal cleavage/methylation domain-containing protein [Actinomycetota bacterium]|nr:prepilin-type N-terminal cleavage/methylation domain-containing protein [Actinomycetota bacterium]
MLRERGFTLLELIAVMALLSILVTLGAGAFRHYWLLHSLDSAQGDVSSQLRQLQARVASESHPLIFGARFTPGTGEWVVIRYDQGNDRTNDSDDTCTTVGEERSFDGITFAGPPDSGFTAPPGVTLAKCGGATADMFVIFYAKGTATGGTLMLRSAALDRTRVLEVSSLTGRVGT